MEASNASVAWLHLWKEQIQKQYKYAIVPSDPDYTGMEQQPGERLKGVLRCYLDVSDSGQELDVYEYWNDTTCQAYAVETGSVIDTGLMPYNSFTLIDTEGKQQSGK